MRQHILGRIWLVTTGLVLVLTGLDGRSEPGGAEPKRGGQVINGVWIGEPVTNANYREEEDIPIRFTTEKYDREALRLLLREANAIAAELHLPETLPLAEKDIMQRHIVPYGLTRHLPMIGKLCTRSYGYFVSVGFKLSYVELLNQGERCAKWVDEYKWPRSLIDTNAAYSLATQWLAAASMDVAGLTRDCFVRSEPEWWSNSINPSNQVSFIPIYRVGWYRNTNRVGEDAASVMLLLPTKTLISLRVEDSKYILRKPLVFTNLNALLGNFYKLPDATR